MNVIYGMISMLHHLNWSFSHLCFNSLFDVGTPINEDLLALGKVIITLGDKKKRKERVHVPCRDRNLTYLLQASE